MDASKPSQLLPSGEIRFQVLLHSLHPCMHIVQGILDSGDILQFSKGKLLTSFGISFVWISCNENAIRLHKFISTSKNEQHHSNEYILKQLQLSNL